MPEMKPSDSSSADGPGPKRPHSPTRRARTSPSEAPRSSKTAPVEKTAQPAAGAAALDFPAHAPHWMDAFFPWVISLTAHFGFFLLAAFITYVTMQALDHSKDGESIIVPNSFEDPAFSDHPGGIPNPGSGDPTRQAAQDKLKELAKSEGWAQNQTMQNVASLLGQNAEVEAVGIFAGSGASIGAGKNGNGSGEGGSAAAYGAPGGGAGNGPRSSFYGTGGNATKIVYILDHSGSMLDNFDFLKEKAKKSVGDLVPVQFFAVVMVSDKVTFVGPQQLQRALPDAKKLFGEAITKERAEGQNDDLLAPFQQAFERAFAMKPELVYFLTDGRFGDGLLQAVNRLNKDKKVHINTIAFVTEDPTYKDQLQQLARENGGAYKFIPERDVGR
jgi:hypothetical protein